MSKKRDGQAELTLGNRQVLLIFFGMVVLCGVFFSLGYIVGRNTFSASAAVAEIIPSAADAGDKPSAMAPPAYLSPGQQAVGRGGDPSAANTDLSFYESVEEKTPEATLLPAESPTASAASPPGPESQLVPEPPSGILVQVSALTRREDADALVTLLQERNLPVLVTSGTTDPLFHVVVGPYRNEQEAEHAKIILEQDGFRPIIKR